MSFCRKPFRNHHYNDWLEFSNRFTNKILQCLAYLLFVVYKSGSGSGNSTEDRIQWLDEKNKTISNDPQKTTQKMEEQEPTGNRGDL